MKPRMVLGLLAATLLWAMPVLAQERPPREPPAELPEKLPAPEQLAVPDCTPPCPDFKILWLEHEYPITTLVPREVVTVRKSPTFVVAYRDEQRQVCDMVLRSREVDKVISCQIMKDVTEIDPSCGKPVTVQKPVLETRTVKELEYFPVPETRTVVVKVPYLQPAEDLVPEKTVLLEYRTEMQKKGYAVRVRGGEVLPDRMIAVPHPCEADGAAPHACEHDGH